MWVWAGGGSRHRQGRNATISAITRANFPQPPTSSLFAQSLSRIPISVHIASSRPLALLSSSPFWLRFHDPSFHPLLHRVLNSLVPHPLVPLSNKSPPLDKSTRLPHGEMLLEKSTRPGNLVSPPPISTGPQLYSSVTQASLVSSSFHSGPQVLSTTFTPQQTSPHPQAWPPCHEKIESCGGKPSPCSYQRVSPPFLWSVEWLCQPSGRNLDFVLRTMRSMESF